MYKNQNTKTLTTIALLAALPIALMFVHAMLMMLIYTVYTLVLKPQKSIMIGVIIGTISFITTGKIFATANIIILPVFAIAIFLLKPYVFSIKDRMFNWSTLSYNGKTKLRLGIMIFLTQLIINSVNEIILAQLLNIPIFTGLIVAFIISFIPAIIIGITGIEISKAFAHAYSRFLKNSNAKPASLEL
ncbi:hypothetical protein ACQCVK_21140 [Rossellomorea vietnamensis]|uniref:Uncharacterized protein n=1 Tax=Rossellomorea aquimaris TaxID=189382 RepID=A0A5D4TVC4_9BACI|nr:hypothetical protein [Rossellomorea aquimaris]TYS79637.1 hypothetical protein FZC80_08270 [Rossellomorea aquimaris]